MFKKVFSLITSLILLGNLMIPTSAYNSSEEKTDFDLSSIIVSISEEYISASFLNSTSIFDTEIVESVEEIYSNLENNFKIIYSVILADKTNNGVNYAIDYFNSIPEVEYAEKNYYKTTNIAIDPTSVNDPLISSQNAYNDINVSTAWSHSTGASDVTVAVIDTGINVNSAELSGVVNIEKSYNFTNDGNGLVDEIGHGTQVASIIAAEGNNNIGFAGIAWNVELINLKVFKKIIEDGEEQQYSTVSWFVNAVNKAIELDVDIINYSASDGNYSQAEYDVISDFEGVFVTSAGNMGMDIDVSPERAYPASYNLDNIIAVGASQTGSLTRWLSSNYGVISVDVCAPGTNILCLSKNGDFVTASGTSFAAPMVAGVAALLLSVNSDLTPSQIKNCIIMNSQKSDDLSSCFVNGRLDALASVETHGYLRGDVDLDWEITEVDVRKVLRYASGMERPTSLQKALADINMDGSVSLSDANIISNIATGNL